MNKGERRKEGELFVWRQYGALQEQGMAHADIIKRLTDYLGEPYASDVGNLNTIINAQRSGGLTGISSAAVATTDYHTKLQAALELGCDIPHMLLQLEALARLAAAASAVWWRGFLSFALYAITLLAVASSVVLIFSIFVLPEFAHLFLSFANDVGSQDANITADILSHRILFLHVPLYTGFILLVIVFTLFYHLRRRMLTMTELAPVWKWLLPTSGIWRSFNTAMALKFANIFIATGAAPNEALNAAFALFGLTWKSQAPVRRNQDRAPSALTFLRLSQELGTLDNEIAIQAENQWSELNDRIFLTRDRVTLLLRIVLYLLIGMIVVFLYQPIFHLGGGI
ncbi:MAG TPA: hypothetical protein VNI53_01290 [Gammaproteobacteria bacterium]|nr:hypothetical protein [Gammaproteobacteria bacterium]